MHPPMLTARTSDGRATPDVQACRLAAVERYRRRGVSDAAGASNQWNPYSGGV
jgi:hypothetical protein